MNSDIYYILISQIPLEYHTRDLRNYFSYSIEKEFFTCFNYRHRPHESKEFNLAICKIKSNKYDEFLKLYNQKDWFDSNGTKLKLKKDNKVKLKCLIKRIKQMNDLNIIDKEDKEDLNKLIEFQRIPDWMSQGNVGTPTKQFIQYINQCKMPQSLIYKLGINLNHYRKYKNNKLYTNVEFKYEQDIDELEEELEDWERHETLHDDVTKQDRTSPYLFEDDIELKWEKGGSGLVFYTDDNFWKDHENKDFDAETADDWDIDMSVYYESNAGDMDSRDLLDMRRHDMLRNGHSSSLIDDEIKLNKNKRLNPFNNNNNNNDDDDDDVKLNNKKMSKFNKYNYGRKHLEKFGWKEGDSIGKSCRSGLKEALDASEGKKPMDKTGIGYHGEKVDKNYLIKIKKDKLDKERRNTEYFIGSKYDTSTSQISDTLLTRYKSKMKYRSEYKLDNQ